MYEIVAEENMVVKNTKNYTKHFKSSGICMNGVIGQKFVKSVQQHLKSSGGKTLYTFKQALCILICNIKSAKTAHQTASGYKKSFSKPQPSWQVF